MILVDTSVLIDFLRGTVNTPSRRFHELLENQVPFCITAQIFQEVLQGAASGKEFDTLKRYLESQRFIHPKDPLASFARAARIYFDCRRKGLTIRSTIDCLIAQIAIEHQAQLLHNDSDFTAMAKVIPLEVL